LTNKSLYFTVIYTQQGCINSKFKKIGKTQKMVGLLRAVLKGSGL